MGKIRKQEIKPVSSKYKLCSEEFDEIAIINSKNKIELIDIIKDYCSKYDVVDYQFTSYVYITDMAYYYYSVIIFYRKKNCGEEVIDNPTKEKPQLEETE
ncbi:MAG: hypothetical protein ACFFAU_01455 [Candidatus Hodarchaeota archaeon]